MDDGDNDSGIEGDVVATLSELAEGGPTNPDESASTAAIIGVAWSVETVLADAIERFHMRPPAGEPMML